MARAYSVDLREKVISHIMSGCSKRETSRIFNIGEDTVYRWVRLHKGGNLKAKKRSNYPRKVDVQKLIEYVEQNPDHTLKQIGQAMNVAYQTVCTWLNRLKITRKKRQHSIKSVMKQDVQNLKNK